ncbi:MAG: META domain-containing protein [Burkholderiales bacterium]|nr:MAG: META domain-containing protein [Burkholderiales bacterium]
MKRLVVWLLALLCASVLATGPETQPLGLTRLQNAAYSGFEDIAGEVRLQSGRWQGEPPQPGSASVPRVDFLGDLVARGDLDGDGVDEAAVMLTSHLGGTGVFHYVAVVGQRGAENRNIDTRLVADRIQLRGMRIEKGGLVLDLVRAGPGDPSCCPSEVVTLEYRLQDGRLTEPVQVGASMSLSPATLSGQRWRLSAWRFGEPVDGRLTLAYVDGRFQGNAGCNAYAAPVTATDDRGAIEVGLALSTQMQCRAQVMANEQRFLGLLPRVDRFWFHAGRLALAYGEGAGSGVMFLTREE